MMFATTRFHVRLLTWLALTLATCMSLAGAACAQGRGQTPQDYPLIVTPDELRKIGIVVRLFQEGQTKSFYADQQPLEHKCHMILGWKTTEETSISSSVLEHYQARGFTLNTVCLALNSDSPLLYHPETGHRLASVQLLLYVEADGKTSLVTELATPRDQAFPIEIPDCMKRGRIYEDCQLNFDIETGRKLTPVQKRRLQVSAGKDRKCFEKIKAAVRPSAACPCGAIGLINKPAAEGAVSRPIQPNCVIDTMPSCPGEASLSPSNTGKLVLETWLVGRYCDTREGEDDASIASIAFLDVTNAIPGGYGYGLGPVDRGAGDPEPMDEKHPSAVKRRGTDSRLAAAAPWLRLASSKGRK